MATLVDLALDETSWDIYTENRDLAVVSGIDAIKQNLRQRFQTFLGENEYDISAGIPYFQDIFKKNPDPILVRSAFVDVAVETPGVLELTNLELDLDKSTRELTITFRAITTSGIVDYGPAVIGLV